MQIKPYHLNPCMPLSSAKLHSYAPRLSITVSVVQLFTSQHFLLQRQSHVRLIGSHSVSRLCQRSLWMSQLEEMEACISAWNNAPAPKWQALDIVGKWMLNSLHNHQQRPRYEKLTLLLLKGREITLLDMPQNPVCELSICQMSLQKKKKEEVPQLSLLKSHTGLLRTAYESGNKDMSERVTVNPISMPST